MKETQTCWYLKLSIIHRELFKLSKKLVTNTRNFKYQSLVYEKPFCLLIRSLLESKFSQNYVLQNLQKAKASKA